MKSTFINTLNLFTSFSTLICCALPALMVALGMGASLAGLLSHVPQLIWISEHKIWFFSFGALMLGTSLYFEFLRKPVSCPIGELKQTCEQTKTLSRPVLYMALIFYSLGFLFAYILPYFL